MVKHTAVKHARGKQLRHSAVQARATSHLEEAERHPAGATQDWRHKLHHRPSAAPIVHVICTWSPGFQKSVSGTFLRMSLLA